MPTTGRDLKQPKLLPAPNSDFYQLAELLPPEDLADLRKVHSFMESEVAPIINKYWVEDSFPFELLPAFKELNIGGLGLQGYGCRGGSALLPASLPWRWHASTCRSQHFSVFTTASPWARSTPPDRRSRNRSGCRRCARMEKIGCFGLTEPLVGSGATGGLLTTAKRDGDTWVLNGQKKWIGNSPWCDISVIWARDVADNQVKASSLRTRPRLALASRRFRTNSR
jgi:glutaryl-CoA dehydrogenase